MERTKAVIAALAVAVLSFSELARSQTAAPATAAVAETKADELLIGPITVTAPVQGVNVAIVSSTYLTLHTTSSGLILKARVVADLRDLQAKIGTIIDTFDLPRNNCASYTLANPVVTIWGKELQATPEGATLWLHGYVDVWQCLENLVPNSKVEWRNDGPFGLPIPHVVTWPGDPIKNKGATQPFDISEPFQVVKVSDTTVGVNLGNPDVKLGGPFVAVTNGILSLAGVNVNDKANEALRKAVDPSKLQASVPPEYMKLNPKIEAAGLKPEGSSLVAEISMSAQVPAAQVNDILQALISKMKPKT